MAGNNEIWALILAAGESKRMNRPKLLLPYMGATIIQKVIENIKKTGVDGIMAVLGGWLNEMTEILKGEDVSVCINENYKRGMLSSVQCGINSLPDSASWAIVFQGDQPGISPAVTEVLIRESRKTEKNILVPVHDGKRGHPLMVGKKYFSEINTLDPDVGLRQLLQRHEKDVFEVSVDNVQILSDIDTPEDYLEAIK